VKSERRKSPDTYSIYKKKDEDVWDAPSFIEEPYDGLAAHL